MGYLLRLFGAAFLLSTVLVTPNAPLKPLITSEPNPAMGLLVIGLGTTITIL